MVSRRLRQPARTALMVCLRTFVGLLLLAVPAMAGQGAGTAAGITGVVADNSGAVLPGVTITATSPALQVPSVTSVSDDRGEYRLSPLPIGVYSVLFELAGFQSVRREALRLTVGPRAVRFEIRPARRERCRRQSATATGGTRLDRPRRS